MAERPGSGRGGSGGPSGGGRPGRTLRLSSDMAWPVGIAVALLVVVLVNLAFIWIAVSDADEVAPSYQEGTR